jgi:hypothetical protein
MRPHFFPRYGRKQIAYIAYGNEGTQQGDDARSSAIQSPRRYICQPASPRSQSPIEILALFAVGAFGRLCRPLLRLAWCMCAQQLPKYPRGSLSVEQFTPLKLEIRLRMSKSSSGRSHERRGGTCHSAQS